MYVYVRINTRLSTSPFCLPRLHTESSSLPRPPCARLCLSVVPSGARFVGRSAFRGEPPFGIVCTVLAAPFVCHRRGLTSFSPFSLSLLSCIPLPLPLPFFLSLFPPLSSTYRPLPFLILSSLLSVSLSLSFFHRTSPSFTFSLLQPSHAYPLRFVGSFFFTSLSLRPPPPGIVGVASFVGSGSLAP